MHDHRLDPDLTLGDVADLEDRAARGDPLSADEATTLGRARALYKPTLTRVTPAMTSLQRVVRSFGKTVGATVNRFAEEYREEFEYVDSLPAWKRTRYEHMTMPQIRRMMCAESSLARRQASPARAVRRESHRTHPGHRRCGATSTTSSADPGDAEPAASRVAVVA